MTRNFIAPIEATVTIPYTAPKPRSVPVHPETLDGLMRTRRPFRQFRPLRRVIAEEITKRARTTRSPKGRHHPATVMNRAGLGPLDRTHRTADVRSKTTSKDAHNDLS
jgi:hypothetical protein